MVRVLGIDPGLSRLGVGVVEASGRRLTARRAAVVRTAPDEAVEARLLAVADAVDAVLAAERPDAVAVEAVFAGANTSTVIGVAQAAGVVLVAAARGGIPVVTYTPSQIKASVTGSGSADKHQVAAMVVAQLHLTQAPKPADAADALAVALCHLLSGSDPLAARTPGARRVAKAAQGAGAWSPRLVAAAAAAGPGAQVAARRPSGGGAR